MSNFPLQKSHLVAFAVHEENVARRAHPHQLHNSFGVGVCTERQILDVQIYIDLWSRAKRRSEVRQINTDYIVDTFVLWTA